jgi:D-alanyl-lipoteichoic acid acyltransferase DltB (MBOAT superfamily)
VLFHTPAFLLLFLPLAVLLRRVSVERPRLDALVLPALGVAFYAFRGPGELALLVGMVAFTHVVVRRLVASPAEGRRRTGLALLGINLIVLLAFKLLQVPGLGVAALALPLGLSFYTFNLLSYGLDVGARRVDPAPSLGALLSYATFFPTVASGPLMRFGDFEAQRAAPRKVDAEVVEAGLLLLTLGLAKKVLVADPLGIAVEPLLADPETLGFGEAWLGTLGYAYQLYFDFSGYTDMAIGAAALLGFRVPPNFDAPYAAASITDFWQRWHMTMSRWFRDYLFLPLSREWLRRSDGSPESADRIRSACLVLTMLAIGLWHGSTWAFAAWGLYHGLLLAAHARLRRVRGLALPAPCARALTFLCVLVGWVLLRSPSPGAAWSTLAALCGAQGFGVDAGSLALWAAVAALLLVTNLPVEAYLASPQRTRAQAWAVAILLVLGLISLGGRSPFLYFQF